jgi:hypothetical protein
MNQKFKLQPGESVRMKGNLNHSVGEAGIKNYLTGKYQVTECTVFLTNQRLVATKARKYSPPFGPLVWLIRAFFARTIVFCIPLADLVAIKLDAVRSMTLETIGGQKYTLNSATFFNKQPQWVTAIGGAVADAVPGTTARQTESAITFSGSATRRVA